MNLIRFAAKWKNGADIIFDWLGSGGKTVEAETAQQRANTCLQCPKHGRKSTLSKPVTLAVKRFLEFKNKAGLRVNGEKSLGQCSVCQCEMRLKLWEPLARVLKHSTSEEMQNYWMRCWILNEKP